MAGRRFGAIVTAFGFMVKVEAEVRLGPSAGDFERYPSARAVLAEKRIDRFQQDRFSASCHLRELRVQPQCSVEIEYAAVESVLAGHIGVSSGYLKMEKREIGRAHVCTPV